MFELMYEFGVFWPISGYLLAELLDKNESVHTSKMVDRVKEGINTQN